MPKKPAQSPQAPQADLLSAPEACKLLGVKPATLYTYVSRGFLRPVQQPNSNASRYWRAEVEGLQVRSSARGGHGAAAALAMRWGQPVLNTSITEITPLGPRYRGHLAEDLTRHPGLFENVAELLWSGVLPDDPRPWRVPPLRADIQRAFEGVVNPDLRIVRVFAIAATALGGVSLADELRSGSIANYSHELLLAFAGACGVIGPEKRFIEPPAETHVAVHVLNALGVQPTEQATQAVNAALILTADHELAPATFTARIAASVGSGLHACIVAALATQVGSTLAGDCDVVESLLSDITSDAGLKSRVREAEQRRERLPGFGHPLYPDGDPRARSLIQLALRIAPASRQVGLATKFVDHVRDHIGIHANTEVGLAILALALGLPPRSSGAVWAIGRTAARPDGSPICWSKGGPGMPSGLGRTTCRKRSDPAGSPALPAGARPWAGGTLGGRPAWTGRPQSASEEMPDADDGEDGRLCEALGRSVRVEGPGRGAGVLHRRRGLSFTAGGEAES